MLLRQFAEDMTSEKSRSRGIVHVPHLEAKCDLLLRVPPLTEFKKLSEKSVQARRGGGGGGGGGGNNPCERIPSDLVCQH
jgi:hypothetical protein